MRSLASIKQEIVDSILDLRSDVRLVAGDTEYDVVVDAPSNEFYRYEVLLELEDRTRNLTKFISVINDTAFKTSLASILGFKQDGTPYSIDDVDDLLSARLDAYVSDWGITRNSGTASSGNVTVFLTDAAPVSWNNGTEFISKSGLSYYPTSSVSDVVPTFNSSLGLYYVKIPIQAGSTGYSTNAVAGSITTVTPKPTNFSYCSNQQAINGGTDIESDLDLINRAQDVWTQRVNGSKAAFERIAEAESYVDDSIALDEDIDDESVYIGSVCDVFTQFSSNDTELIEETMYWPGEANNADEEQFDFIPKNQPMISTITPTIFIYTLGGTEEQVVPDGTNTVVSIVQDTNTFSGSPKANDKIRIKMALNTSSYQRKLKVLYNYDRNPYKLQSVFDDTEEKMIGPSVLVRKAADIPIRVIVEIQTAFGYAASDVQENVSENISTYFNGGTTTFGRQYARKQIGEDITHSDIAEIILRTDGVISYDRDTFFVVNTVTGDLSDPSTILSNQYASLYDVLFEYSAANLSNFTASSGGI